MAPLTNLYLLQYVHLFLEYVLGLTFGCRHGYYFRDSEVYAWIKIIACIESLTCWKISVHPDCICFIKRTEKISDNILSKSYRPWFFVQSEIVRRFQVRESCSTSLSHFILCINKANGAVNHRPPKCCFLSPAATITITIDIHWLAYCVVKYVCSFFSIYFKRH